MWSYGFISADLPQFFCSWDLIDYRIVLVSINYWGDIRVVLFGILACECVHVCVCVCAGFL